MVLLVAAPAHAERQYSLFGLGGSAGIDGVPGLVLHSEAYGQDTEGSDDGMVIAMHAGTRYWRTGGAHWGLDVPIGMSFGARASGVSATLGAGSGIAALELRGRDVGFGVTPYANARLGFELGREWLTSVDLRATRAVLIGVPDRTEFDIVVLVGKHSHY